MILSHIAKKDIYDFSTLTIHNIQECFLPESALVVTKKYNSYEETLCGCYIFHEISCSVGMAAFFFHNPDISNYRVIKAMKYLLSGIKYMETDLQCKYFYNLPMAYGKLAKSCGIEIVHSNLIAI